MNARQRGRRLHRFAAPCGDFGFSAPLVPSVLQFRQFLKQQDQRFALRSEKRSPGRPDQVGRRTECPRSRPSVTAVAARGRRVSLREDRHQPSIFEHDDRLLVEHRRQTRRRGREHQMNPALAGSRPRRRVCGERIHQLTSRDGRPNPRDMCPAPRIPLTRFQADGLVCLHGLASDRAARRPLRGARQRRG